MDMVTRPHAKNFVRWAKDKPQVLVLSADLTSSCEVDAFRDTYPARFFSLGVAEQNMMGVAAGLAREGFRPFIHTFSVFICRRPFDQVAMSIGYPNLPVRLIGFLPGITTPGGVTHQSIDDIGLMRMIPNMTILECSDATEVESSIGVADSIDGPVYVRMLRGEVPRLFPANQPMILGCPRILRKGLDLLVVSSGICTEEAIRAVHALTVSGIDVGHLHVSTLKPFDPESLITMANQSRYGVISVENHSVIGGLGAIVAESMAEAGLGKKLIRLGLKDVYAHGASKEYLMKKYGLDARSVIRAAESLCSRALNIGDESLRSVPIDVGAIDANAEAL